jgi:hypothetical protein
MIVQTGWVPRKRNVNYQEKPEYVPDWVYTEAQTAKRFYNEQWEFWVWEIAQRDNVSQAVAEDACIRGIKIALDRVNYAYSSIFGPQLGSKIAKWYLDYLGLEDIFSKVKHPEYKEVKLEGV